VRRRSAEICKLFLEDLFDIADFLLNFPTELLVHTFSFEVRIIRGVANLLLQRALRVMHCAFDFVFGAVFHIFAPVAVKHV
jgi:hypothetical protein